MKIRLLINISYKDLGRSKENLNYLWKFLPHIAHRSKASIESTKKGVSLQVHHTQERGRGNVYTEAAACARTAIQEDEHRCKQQAPVHVTSSGPDMFGIIANFASAAPPIPIYRLFRHAKIFQDILPQNTPKKI